MRHGLLALLLLLTVACRKAEGESCSPGECRGDLVCETGTCFTCARSPGCAKEGNCALHEREDRCLPATEAHCRRSEACTTQRRCWFDGYSCIPHDPSGNNTEGGCPCGCDRSEDLVDELRGLPRGEALASARRSLATIGEREQLGYVTEAMVQHRLRLKAFEAELLVPGEAAFEVGLHPRTPELRAARMQQTPRTAGDLAVRSELLVFGATTEIVGGRSKDLKPCFRLWLRLENQGSQARTLPRPTVHGEPGTFDVRRWYLEDGDGAAWDGVLPPGEARSVLLVGDLDAPVQPGQPVTARWDVGGLAIEETHAALGRWDAHAVGARDVAAPTTTPR